jgi:hypothetical protein
MFGGAVPKINNLNWMKVMDKYLISLISVGDMGQKALERIPKPWSQTK